MAETKQLADMIDEFDAADEHLPLEQMSTISKSLRSLQEEVDRLNDLLICIGDFAHDKSTGPAVPDALWDVRNMAYQQ